MNNKSKNWMLYFILSLLISIVIGILFFYCQNKDKTWLYYLYKFFISDKDWINCINQILAIISLPSLFITCKALIDINEVRKQVKIEETLKKALSLFRDYDKKLFVNSYEDFQIDAKQLLDDLTKKIVGIDDIAISPKFKEELKFNARKCYEFIDNSVFIKCWTKNNSESKCFNPDIWIEYDESSANFEYKEIVSLLDDLKALYSSNKIENIIDNYQKLHSNLSRYVRLCGALFKILTENNELMTENSDEKEDKIYG